MNIKRSEIEIKLNLESDPPTLFKAPKQSATMSKHERLLKFQCTDYVGLIRIE